MEHYRRARSTLSGCSVMKSFKGNKIFYLRQEIAPKWQELRVKCCSKTSNGAIQVHPERSDAPHGCYRASSLRSGCLKERPIPILAASLRALPERGSTGARIPGRLGVF